MSSAHVYPAFRGILDGLSGRPGVPAETLVRLRRAGATAQLDAQACTRLQPAAVGVLRGGQDLALLCARLGSGMTSLGASGVSGEAVIEAAVEAVRAAEVRAFRDLLGLAGSDAVEAATLDELACLLRARLRENEEGLPDLKADERSAYRTAVR